MDNDYQQLLEANKIFSERYKKENPSFFEDLAKAQNPTYLWIGCSDSRVPPNEITGTKPGEIFIHRNVANMVVHTDLNLLTVLEYAVNYLNVKHIIVCGHYGCGGVAAAMSNKNYGIINKWIRNIKDVYRLHQSEIENLQTEELKLNKLIELNIQEQVTNLAKTSIIQKSWKHNKRPYIHGWVYGLNDGLIKQVCEMGYKDKLDRIYEFDDL